MRTKKETSYNTFCPMHGQCPDIERIEQKVASMSNRIDVILIGIISILTTILGSMVII